MIPAKKDEKGFSVGPKSECCSEALVYFDEDAGLFLTVPYDHERLPEKAVFRCKLCDKEVSRA